VAGLFTGSFKVVAVLAKPVFNLGVSVRKEAARQVNNSQDEPW